MSFLFPMRPSAPRLLPATPEGFAFQVKYDGWNVVINRGRVYTRHGREITDWWPAWATAFRSFDLPLNGELLAFNGQRSDIPSIRTGKFRPVVKVFDVIFQDAPFEERQDWLTEHVGHTRYEEIEAVANLRYENWKMVNIDLEYQQGCGNEGFVLKRKGSPYVVGSDLSVVTPDWLKLKVPVDF